MPPSSPDPSRWAQHWFDRNVGDQTGRTFLITGANGGLGAATAAHLAHAGARVILACRRPDRGDEVARTIGAGAEVLPLDLADLDATAAAAQASGPVDAVIAVAGVCHAPWGLTADGFEQHIGVNHLGHFAFIGQLLDRVQRRVVVITSRAHEFCGRPGFGDFVPEDPTWKSRRYSSFDAYCQSKLANLLYANELQRRFDSTGSSKIAVAAQPGWADTDAGMHSGRWWGDVFWRASCALFRQPPEVGALSIAYAAAAEGVTPAGYYGPDRLFGMRGLPTAVKAAARASDSDLMERTWSAAQRYTGVSHDV
ncbi:NAD(P)-dependent dehydrogenase (short-subunit alcohol dehydrogenase family) [Mycolicibacterium iranicum]|uniref:NAD(P)-dependent dehydrogenase (Short-subunit alcohol dehydrogenase family) n=1 Tax=Mycolicibacterium iranicum TaxID=912594 RepID=A0A839QHS9_MYCIR|nr:SDR family NAD(P)-dependent oxidoreductase [Mycolicibacterium iranicum]MBB2993626.1 NAD(P)-dependent dehydrogenase (short-subunit alcohol dehydrogenase family) [Mycolicibacterium iranicum]